MLEVGGTIHATSRRFKGGPNGALQCELFMGLNKAQYPQVQLRGRLPQTKLITWRAGIFPKLLRTQTLNRTVEAEVIRYGIWQR